jgi:glycosyltransferase involved in cell wall biosynthesis
VVEVNDLWYHVSSLDRAGRIVVHGGGTREHIPARYHEKSIWVHGAVDMAEYRDARPLPIEGLEGRRGVAYTGSMLAWHGIPDLARALPAVLERVPEAALVVAGEASSDAQREVLDALRRAVEVAGDPGALVALGRVPHGDIPGVLGACQLAVAPYDPAGEPDLGRYGFWYSPMKLWEYMAAGRAVVSTDLPSIREIVGKDRGVLVPPGDPAALADAIAGLLEDGPRREAMGRAGRAFAKENTWERRVDEYERALVEALEGGTHPDG